MCCPKFHIGKKFYVIHEIQNKREIIESKINCIYGTPGNYNYKLYEIDNSNPHWVGEVDISEHDLLYKNQIGTVFFETRHAAEAYIEKTLTAFEKRVKDEQLYKDTISLFEKIITEAKQDVPIEFINARIFENICNGIKEIKKEYAQFQAQEKG